MAECRCTEKGLYLNDKRRLESMKSYIDSSYSYITEIETEIINLANNELSAYDAHNKMCTIDAIRKVDNELRTKWDKLGSEIDSLYSSISDLYDAYCIEDKEYHDENDNIEATEDTIVDMPTD